MIVNYDCTVIMIVNYFRGGATFEMIELNTEKCIFRLILFVAAQRLINGRRIGKVAERQRERMCVRASVGQT